MHPYSRFVGLLLKGSMSLDFRVALLPYKSSSFATPEGGKFAHRPALELISISRVSTARISPFGVASEHDS